ncbi:hypothetical protein D3C86_1694160 [compost metagenome]
MLFCSDLISFDSFAGCSPKDQPSRLINDAVTNCCTGLFLSNSASSASGIADRSAINTFNEV